jgi:hypothetical protein
MYEALNYWLKFETRDVSQHYGLAICIKEYLKAAKEEELCKLK